MARRVPTAFRKLPRETYRGLRDTKELTSSRAFDVMRARKVPVVTPLASVRKIAGGLSRKTGVPIVVTSKPFVGVYSEDDGLAKMEEGRPKVYIHPVVQYYDRNYVKQLMKHELDHIKVMLRSERWMD